MRFDATLGVEVAGARLGDGHHVVGNAKPRCPHRARGTRESFDGDAVLASRALDAGDELRLR